MKKLTLLLLLTFICKSFAADQNQRKTIALDEAIKIALENNASLQAAQESYRAAGYRVKRSRSELLPKADLQFGYSRLDPGSVRRSNVFLEVGRTLIEQFSENDPQDLRPNAYSNNFSTVFQVVQPLYNGGALWAGVSAAWAQKEGEQHQVEDTKQQVILDVKTRYLQALQASELVVLSQKSLEASEEHLDSARKMLEVGLRNRTDVLRWDVQKANSEGQLIEAENNLQLALAALKQTMGLEFTDEIRLVPVEFEPDTLLEDFETQAQQIRRHHPNIKGVAATLDAQRAGVRMAWSAFQPKVNFIYQYGWEKNNTLALDTYSYWNAGITVNFPIFHSFSNVARLQETKAELNHLKAKEREVEQQLTLELIRARLSVETALKKYRIAKKAAQLAAENLRVVDNSYGVGLAANLDLLDAQVVHTRAGANLIRSRYDYWIARAQLERATGTLSAE